MMKVKSLLLISSLSLVACGDNDDNQNDYKYGRLKSDPPIPPLTYTWSHPDCPFTANFPGKPEEEVIEQEDGVSEIFAQFNGENYGYQIYCDINSLVDNKPISDVIANEYVNLLAKENFMNSKIKDISELKKLNNFRVYFESEILVERNIPVSTYIFQHKLDLLSATIFHKSSQMMKLQGIEFIENIKLK